MLRDRDLLQDFVDRGSDDAFRALVERHSGMVHGTALRILRDDGLAQEVTQAVFVLLARKASTLPRGTIVAGWLYRSSRLVALEAVRTERRRQQRHEAFAQMNATTDSVWSQVEPLFDEVMSRLASIDRDAVVLRFLEDRSFTEVANALGTTEAAAKMRVGRALEKLRSAFARRGVVVPAATLLATLSAHATASAAPVGLSSTVATIALAKETAIGSTLLNLVEGALKVMAWAKIKSAIALGTIVLLATGGAVVFQQEFSPRTGSASLTSLDPMNGEWEGIYESRTGGKRNFARPVKLSIGTTRQGRACDVVMRVADDAGQPDTVYRFTHALNEAGDRITTVDDPQIRSRLGEGVITESRQNHNTGRWATSFRAPHPNSDGFTEWHWDRKGDDLLVARHDRIITSQGSQDLYSTLRLRRQAASSAIPTIESQ